MRTISALVGFVLVVSIAILGIASVTEAQQTIVGSVVVPSLGWSSSGFGYNLSIFEGLSRRQQVYVTAGFPVPGAITAIAFRRADVSFPVGGSAPTLRLKLSTTPLGPSGLSPIFDLNTGPDVTTVFDSAINFPPLAGGQGCSPLGNGFLYLIPFTQPFTFSGGGNLLLELQVFSGPCGCGANGYQSYASSPAEASSIVSVGPTPNAFAGLPVNAAYVTLFQFAATPASVALYGTGCPQSNSVMPQIGTANLPTVGSFCSPFSVTLTGALPYSVAILVASVVPASIPLAALPNCTLLVNPSPYYWFVGTDSGGSAQKDFQIPNAATFIGASIYFQWAVIDGGIGLPYPFAFSAGLQATIGI